MEVFIKIKKNERVIERHFNYYLHMKDFLLRFINPKEKEGFKIIYNDDEHQVLVMQKDDVIIMCVW